MTAEDKFREVLQNNIPTPEKVIVLVTTAQCLIGCNGEIISEMMYSGMTGRCMPSADGKHTVNLVLELGFCTSRILCDSVIIQYDDVRGSRDNRWLSIDKRCAFNILRVYPESFEDDVDEPAVFKMIG